MPWYRQEQSLHKILFYAVLIGVGFVSGAAFVSFWGPIDYGAYFPPWFNSTKDGGETSIKQDDGEEKWIKREDGTLIPRNYGGKILQIGGQGSRLVQVEAWPIAGEFDDSYLNPAEDWVSYGMSRPGDVLNAWCAKEYRITSCEDRKGRAIDKDPDLCSILIEDQLQNVFYITCEHI